MKKVPEDFMMKKSMKRIAAILLAFAVAFTMMPAMAGSLDVHAASYWQNVRAAAKDQTHVEVSWKALTKKQKRKIGGITVFRDGQPVKYLSKNAKSFVDSGLQAGTTHTYQLKTYKKYTKKTKMWYNKQTGEYQKKKPAKKYRGKRKTFKEVSYKYYNACAPLRVTTTAAAPTKYTITWKNWDGTVLQTVSVEKGTTPKYTGSTPQRSGYTFTGWSPSVVAASANAAYTAQFKANTPAAPTKYTITWKNWDGTVLQTVSVEKDATPKYTGSTPQRAADSGNTYSFTGWYPSVSLASKDASYTAQFKATAKPGAASSQVQITDYLGTVRTVSTDSAEYKNPLYNRDIDGEFVVRNHKYIQRNGVTFKPDYCTGGYNIRIYNGEYNKLSYALSRKEYSYTKWGNELDNPSSQTAYYILGNNGRRLAEVTRDTSGGIILNDLYYDIGDVTITAKYNGAVIDTYTLTVNGTGKTGSDGFSPGLRNAYDVAKTAVTFFRNGGSFEGPYTQEWYKEQKAYGDYYADMKAIEAYVYETYTYDEMDCWGGYAILDAYSVVAYGEYGDWCNPIPEHTGHRAFRPYSYCEQGAFCNPSYSGKGSYFQTNGHH